MEKDRDPELDELIQKVIAKYVQLRKTLEPRYTYGGSAKFDKYFEVAAQACREMNMHPADYVLVQWNRINNRKLFFPQYLGTTEAIQAAADEVARKTEVDYTLRLADQKAKLSAIIRNTNNSDVIGILMNEHNRFFAWFRIVITSEPIPEIVDKYKKIAFKELNPKLEEFLRSNKYEVDRIYG